MTRPGGDRPAPLFGVDLGQLRSVTANQLALRFAFGAAASIIAGVGGIALGAVVGGILLGFPAIAPATLTLLERDDGNPAAVHDIGGAVFGGVGLVAFAVVATFGFARLRAPLVLAACLAAWTLTAVGLYVARSKERIPLPRAIQGATPAHHADRQDHHQSGH